MRDLRMNQFLFWNSRARKTNKLSEIYSEQSIKNKQL